MGGIGYDIGTEQSDPAPRLHPRAARRALPKWAGIVIALLLGWMLGALMNSRPEAAPVTQELPDEPVETPQVATEPVTVVMVQAPLRGVAIPADITVIDNGVGTRVELDRQIAGATQSVVGQRDQRMLVVGEDVAFMALDAVMVFDPVAKSEPVEVARAIYLLPGSEEGRAWAVTSGSRSVIDVDVRRRSARAEYDLTAIGVPLGSYNGGLVVAPANRSFGDFALWNPARGIEKLWSMHEEATFIGAAGNVLVVHTPQGLAAYNTVTGSMDQTDFDLVPSAQRRSIVSPDGSKLAIALQGSVTELPTVAIVDTSTGEQVDSFQAAFAWQLQWISSTEVLFMRPAGRSVDVMLRNTGERTSSEVTNLAGPNFWVTVAG